MPQSDRATSPWLSAAAWGVGVAAAAAALELALRTSTRRPMGNPFDHRLFCEMDPRLGWRKIPNFAATRSTSEYTVREHFNSRGLRGPEWPIARSDAYRVLVLGDSFVEGYGVAAEDMCTHVLERELRSASGRDVEVINGATGGYSTDQELLFFEGEGRVYAPDLTILVFYENDLWDNTRGNVSRAQKPRFVLGDDHTLVLADVAAAAPVSEEWSPALTTARLLLQRSRLWQCLRQGAMNWALLASLAWQHAKTRFPGYRVPLNFWVWADVEPEAVTAAYRLAESLVRRLRDAVVSSGSEFLVVYAPSQPAVNDRMWRVMRTHWGMPESGWSPARVGSRIGEICRRNGITCLDTTPDLRARAADGTSVYYPLDGHWNAIGHRVAAQCIARQILPLVAMPRAGARMG